MIATGAHDAILGAIVASIPVLLVLWIAVPDLPGEVAALRAEVARLRAERQAKEDVAQTSRPTIH